MRNHNGTATSFSEHENPFADEMTEESETSTTSYNLPSELESPFAYTYETDNNVVVNQQQAEAFVQLLSELNQEDFKESLVAISGEMEEFIVSRFSHEVVDGNSYRYLQQRTNEYLAPLFREVDTMIDRVNEFTSDNDFRSRSESEIDQFISELEFDHAGDLTPAQEQLFGGIVNKIKSAVKAGKKILDKVSPVHIVLNKIKGLIKPILNKVLNSLIGKLPSNLRPFAKDLAKKFLKLEVPTEDGAITGSNETFSGEDFEALQYEFDLRIANLVFSNDEVESDQLINDYLLDSELNGTTYRGNSTLPSSLDNARQKFIDQLRNDEDVQPALEQFLPALYPAIKVAISIAGRKRVVDFLAGLLAKLIKKYVPHNVARPLASSIVDLGLNAVGFEVTEQQNEGLAYEAIANTVEETIRTLGTENDGILNQLNTLSDSEAIDQLAEHVLPAFNKAAANNFPGTYIKKDLQCTKEPGVWILMPRKSSKKAYKKYSNVFTISLTHQVAEYIKSFGDISLKDLVRDTLGQDLSNAVQARIHLYEAIPGTALNKISLYERTLGLGTADKSAWIQIHPLSVQAASSLLNEPALGKDVEPEFTSSQEKITVGQRFFYIEMPGTFVRRPRIRNHTHIHKGEQNELQITARTSDIQIVFNFIKSDITLNFFFSEAGANEIVKKLNRNDWICATEQLRSFLRGKLAKALLKNIKSKVKIVHEAVPELYLRNVPENEDFLGDFTKMALEKIIKKITERFLSTSYSGIKNFFKTRAKEFSDALTHPDDGVTIRIAWTNVAGMSQIRSVINLLRGEGSIMNIGNISMPSLQTPVVIIKHGKNFM